MSRAEIEALNLFKDVHSDHDRSDIRDDARPALASGADVLRRLDLLTVTLEGHCSCPESTEECWARNGRAKVRVACVADH